MVKSWWDGREDDCTGLENRSVRKGTGGSNPPPTAFYPNSSFGRRLPRGYAARQAREARQRLILQGFATLRVA